jgi:methionine biosynthesis protein MetW
VRSVREAIQSFLLAVYRGTERLNKDEILRSLSAISANNILDCGCGDGSFTLELAQTVGASDVYGIEVDPPRVAAARSRGVHVELSDLNDAFPFEDGTFDIVHANQVIEHVVSSDHFLREIRRVLMPGGVAVVSTNNLSSWHNIASLVMGFQPPPAHPSSEVILGNPLDPLRGSPHPTPGDSHLRLFSFGALRDLCRFHGFRVNELKTAGYYPLPARLAIWFTRVDKRHGAFLIAKLQKEERSAV